MLAERFQELIEARAAEAEERQEARQARDAFIKLQFEALDQAFADLVVAVTGSHPRLSVVSTAVTEAIANRHFATLDKTVTEVHSTLYGTLEQVRFFPALEFVETDQFGAIRVTTEDVPAAFGTDGQAALHKAMLKRGILMRGQASAHLVVKTQDGFAPLTADLLESFLARLFIRTET